ncbi:hypothetical protein D3C79_1055290 [compost metagenome]
MPVTSTGAGFFTCVTLPLGVLGLTLALPMPFVIAVPVPRVGVRSARSYYQCDCRDCGN